jgi:putative alpha-1,2-mannosidase
MVKIGPDMFTGGDTYSGDEPVGNFTGFSMMHESGTGGASKYGVVSQMPVLVDIPNPLDNLNDTRKVPDNSSVGYYKASLGSNITVELGATSRAGYYQYTFPIGKQANVVVDVSHVLPSYRDKCFLKTTSVVTLRLPRITMRDMEITIMGGIEPLTGGSTSVVILVSRQR